MRAEGLVVPEEREGSVKRVEVEGRDSQEVRAGLKPLRKDQAALVGEGEGIVVVHDDAGSVRAEDEQLCIKFGTANSGSGQSRSGADINAVHIDITGVGEFADDPHRRQRALNELHGLHRGPSINGFLPVIGASRRHH